MKYFINYHTAAGNETIDGTLDEAKFAADDGATYTLQDIEILDEDGDRVLIRRWVGVDYNNGYESENPIIFGNFGFYDDWE